MFKTIPLAELENEIVELDMTASKFDGLRNAFFGKITGRVRVVVGEHSPEPAVWIGDFCFYANATVTRDTTERKGLYKMNIGPMRS